MYAPCGQSIKLKYVSILDLNLDKKKKEEHIQTSTMIKKIYNPKFKNVNFSFGVCQNDMKMIITSAGPVCLLPT